MAELKLKIARQAGTVLITVLLVVSFIALLLLEIGKTVNYQANLNRNLLQRDQGYEYLLGMEELAKIYLKRAFDNDKDETVNLGQAWAKKNITFPIDGGSMSGAIRDMQSCFNLNSIANLSQQDDQSGRASATGGFPTVSSNLNANSSGQGANIASTEQNELTLGEKLLTLLVEKTVDNPQVQASAIAASVRDWIDKDITPNGPDGVEDSFYQGLEIPYLPPNGPIAHESELRTVKNVDPITYAQIKHNLCVLPDSKEDKINVNTITLQGANLLYAALAGKVTMESVNKLITERPDSGYTLQSFWDKVGSNIKIPKRVKAQLGVTSHFFQLEAKAEIQQTRVYLKTLFIKDEENNFVVVSRYFGKE